MGRLFKLILPALLASPASLAHAQSGDWIVSESAGSVTITDGGHAQPVRRGAVIAPGATLSTGAGARAVVVHGKDFVTVSANSRVRIPTATQKQGLFEVIQEWGNAIFQIDKQPNPHFGVQTPYLAAVVKGTTFSITVTQQGASLQVVEGAVETSTLDGGAKDLIRPGIVALVRSDDVYRLTVQGQDTRQVDSPQRGVEGQAAAAPAVAPAAVEPASSDSQTIEASDAAAASTVADQGAAFNDAQFVTETVGSSAVDLGKATSGLVTGNAAAMQLAAADVAVLRSGNDDRGGQAAPTLGSSDNSGIGGSAASGSSSTDIGGAAAAAGSSNAGGIGDASAGSADNNAAGNANAGAGNDNAGGNGNANVGSENNNAGGNGNSGSENAGAGNNDAGGNGNASVGSGNSNAGVNGNGNSGNANAGAGNSNAGGNGNAGNAGSGNSGNANWWALIHEIGNLLASAHGNGNLGNSGNGNGNGNSNGNGNGGGGNSGNGGIGIGNSSH